MIAALLLLLASTAHAGVARAPAALGRLPLSAAATSVSAPPSLPPFLSVADPADGPRLAAVLQAAQASPTAVAVLARVARAAEARGRPVLVEVADMEEAGTWNLDWGILSLRRGDMNAAPRENVSTLIHELQHLLQTRPEIPSDLLETELEAFVVDFRVGRELGVRPAPGSHDARAQAAFREGLEPFLGYLRAQYPENAQLHKTRARAYEARLRAGLEASVSELERLSVERADRERVLDRMRALGHSRAEVEHYRQDAVAPIDADISAMRRAIGWAKADLAILADPAARARARAYARSVIRRARAFQKIFARD